MLSVWKYLAHENASSNPNYYRNVLSDWGSITENYCTEFNEILKKYYLNTWNDISLFPFQYPLTFQDRDPSVGVCKSEIEKCYTKYIDALVYLIPMSTVPLFNKIIVLGEGRIV